MRSCRLLDSEVKVVSSICSKHANTFGFDFLGHDSAVLGLAVSVEAYRTADDTGSSTDKFTHYSKVSVWMV